MLLMAGCSSTLQLDPATIEMKTPPLAEVIPNSDVGMDEKLSTLIDVSQPQGTIIECKVGPTLQSVFTGGPDAPILLKYVDSRLTYDTVSTGMVTSDAVFSYRLSVSARINEAEHLLQANSRGQDWNYERALKDVIEETVADLARQIKALP